MKKYTLIIISFLCMLLCGVNAQNSQSTFKGVKKTTITGESKLVHEINKNEAPKCLLSDSLLTIKNVKIGTEVNIYSVLGTKVYSFVYKGSPVSLKLKKGIYIVRIDKFTQKIMM